MVYNKRVSINPPNTTLADALDAYCVALEALHATALDDPRREALEDAVRRTKERYEHAYSASEGTWVPS